jgi:C4-type Zn-finger protein
MLHDLQKSVAVLQQPNCPTCTINMLWFRAQRPATYPNSIWHFFQCQQCHYVEEAITLIAENR